MTRPREEWKHDVAGRYKALEKFSKEDARLQFLRILRSLPYGNLPSSPVCTQPAHASLQCQKCSPILVQQSLIMLGHFVCRKLHLLLSQEDRGPHWPLACQAHSWHQQGVPLLCVLVPFLHHAEEACPALISHVLPSAQSTLTKLLPCRGVCTSSGQCRRSTSTVLSSVTSCR